MKFLIVDDHPLLREGLSARLKSYYDEAEIVEAENGEEAVGTAWIEKPDLIIMDVTMPVMDGIEATRLIKKANPAMPVIMLSFHKDREVLLSAFDAGASGYLQKSMERNKIPLAIDKVMDGGMYISKEMNKILQQEIEQDTHPDHSEKI